MSGFDLTKPEGRRGVTISTAPGQALALLGGAFGGRAAAVAKAFGSGIATEPPREPLAPEPNAVTARTDEIVTSEDDRPRLHAGNERR